MQITQMDKDTAKTIAARAQLAMKALEDELGVTIQVKNGTIRGGSLELSMMASVGDEVRYEDTPDGRAYMLYAQRYDLDPKRLGTTFKITDRQGRMTLYRITGLKTSRPKFPVSAERVSDGHRFKFPADVVRRAL